MHLFPKCSLRRLTIATLLQRSIKDRMYQNDGLHEKIISIITPHTSGVKVSTTIGSVPTECGGVSSKVTDIEEFSRYFWNYTVQGCYTWTTTFYVAERIEAEFETSCDATSLFSGRSGLPPTAAELVISRLPARVNFSYIWRQLANGTGSCMSGGWCL